MKQSRKALSLLLSLVMLAAFVQPALAGEFNNDGEVLNSGMFSNGATGKLTNGGSFSNTGSFVNENTAEDAITGANPLVNKSGATISGVSDAMVDDESSGGSGGVTVTVDGATGVITVSGTGDMENYGGVDWSLRPWLSAADADHYTSAVVGEGVTSVGEYAFSDLIALSKASLSSTVTRIGGHAFYDCAALEEIAIPASVTSIGEGAFDRCGTADGVAGVAKVNFGGTRAQWAAITGDKGALVGTGTTLKCSDTPEAFAIAWSSEQAGLLTWSKLSGVRDYRFVLSDNSASGSQESCSFELSTEDSSFDLAYELPEWPASGTYSLYAEALDNQSRATLATSNNLDIVITAAPAAAYTTTVEDLQGDCQYYTYTVTSPAAGVLRTVDCLVTETPQFGGSEGAAGDGIIGPSLRSGDRLDVRAVTASAVSGATWSVTVSKPSWKVYNSNEHNFVADSTYAVRFRLGTGESGQPDGRLYLTADLPEQPAEWYTVVLSGASTEPATTCFVANDQGERINEFALSGLPVGIYDHVLLYRGQSVENTPPLYSGALNTPLTVTESQTATPVRDVAGARITAAAKEDMVDGSTMSGYLYTAFCFEDGYTYSLSTIPENGEEPLEAGGLDAEYNWAWLPGEFYDKLALTAESWSQDAGGGYRLTYCRPTGAITVTEASATAYTVKVKSDLTYNTALAQGKHYTVAADIAEQYIAGSDDDYIYYNVPAGETVAFSLQPLADNGVTYTLSPDEPPQLGQLELTAETLANADGSFGYSVVFTVPASGTVDLTELDAGTVYRLYAVAPGDAAASTVAAALNGSATAPAALSSTDAQASLPLTAAIPEGGKVLLLPGVSASVPGSIGVSGDLTVMDGAKLTLAKAADSNVRPALCVTETGCLVNYGTIVVNEDCTLSGGAIRNAGTINGGGFLHGAVDNGEDGVIANVFCAVTLHGNGGVFAASTGNSTTSALMRAPYGEALAESALTKPAWAGSGEKLLSGWTTDEAGANAYGFSATAALTSALDLYAQWDTAYTVNFQAASADFDLAAYFALAFDEGTAFDSTQNGISAIVPANGTVGFTITPNEAEKTFGPHAATLVLNDAESESLQPVSVTAQSVSGSTAKKYTDRYEFEAAADGMTVLLGGGGALFDVATSQAEFEGLNHYGNCVAILAPANSTSSNLSFNFGSDGLSVEVTQLYVKTARLSVTAANYSSCVSSYEGEPRLTFIGQSGAGITVARNAALLLEGYASFSGYPIDNYGTFAANDRVDLESGDFDNLGTLAVNGALSSVKTVSLKVEDGVTLTNAGELEIAGDAALELLGTLSDGDGAITNNGRLLASADALEDLTVAADSTGHVYLLAQTADMIGGLLSKSSYVAYASPEAALIEVSLTIPANGELLLAEGEMAITGPVFCYGTIIVCAGARLSNTSGDFRLAPSGTSSAVLDLYGSFEISAETGCCTIDSGAALNVCWGGTLLISEAGSVENHGTLTVKANGTLTLDSGGQAGFNNYGTLSIELSGKVENGSAGFYHYNTKDSITGMEGHIEEDPTVQDLCETAVLNNRGSFTGTVYCYKIPT